MLSLLYLVALALPQSSPQELYSSTKIWKIGLAFTPEQWSALQPPMPNFGFGPPGGGGPNAGTMLSYSFLKQGDTNRDRTLSKAELLALGERWFTTWDATKAGKVDGPTLTRGLNQTLKSAPMSLQGQDGKRNGVMGMMGVELPYTKGTLTFEDKKLEEVAVRYKGNGTYLSSMMSVKRPFKLDLNKYVKTNSLAGAHTLNLHNGVADPSGMNDVLAHRFFRDAGVPSPRTTYARVSLTVPGVHDNKYLGLYEIVEDVGSTFLQHNFGTSDGALFKPSTPELFGYLGDDWARYNQTYEPKKATEAEKKRLIALCKLVTLGSQSEFAAQIGSFIALPELAKYLAALVCVTDLDGILGPGQNLYLWLNPKTGKLHFIPWDYDQSWGQFGMRGTQQEREQLAIAHPWQGDNLFLERLFAVPAFQKLYRAELARLTQTLFLPERIAAQVDELDKLLRAPITDESPQRLKQLDLSVAGKLLPPSGPFDFGGAGTKPIKLFVPIRARSLKAQLAGTSKGLRLSEFSMFGPGGGMGQLFGAQFLKTLDGNGDGSVTRTESRSQLEKLFAAWSAQSGGASALTEEQLTKALGKTFALPAFGPPPGGFGPPPR